MIERCMRERLVIRIEMLREIKRIREQVGKQCNRVFWFARRVKQGSINPTLFNS